MSDDLIEKIARAIHETDSTTTTTWKDLCDLAGRDGYMTAKLKQTPLYWMPLPSPPLPETEANA